MNSSPQNQEVVGSLKMVLLGNSAVGKTSLVLRFTSNSFKENHECTIGAAFATKVVEVKNRSIRLNIWDTGGQERYKSMAPMYYRAAGAAIVVYDITQARSLDSAREWIQELRQRATSDIILYLVGNKLDLAMEKRAVNTEEGQRLAQENGMMFSEVSAKSGLGVNDILTSIASKVLSSTGVNFHGKNKDTVSLANGKKESSGCRC